MNKRTGILRVLMTACCCMLAAGLAIGLSGCGKSNDEELIRTSVTEVMEVFKNPTEENLKQFVDSDTVDTTELDKYDIDIYEFLGHCFKHFSYEIGEVKVDGDKATVDVTLTNANVSKAMENATNKVMGNIDQYTDMLSAEDGQKEFMKVFFDEIYAELDATDDLVTSNETLSLTKTDGEWDVDKTSLDSVVSAMYGGLEI